MTTIRRPGVASAAVLVGLTASLFAAHLIAPDWSRRAGLDVWNLGEAERDRRAVAEERADLDATADRLHLQIEAADHVAARLIAGTVALPDAADELAALLRDCPGRQLALDRAYGDALDQRRQYALHAIDRAARLLEDDPARRDAVRARLEEEYRAMASEQ
jgi:hypothetical protein